MIRISVFIYLLLYVLCSFAQKGSFNLNGMVSDSESNEGIPGVSIVLKDDQNKIIAQTISESNGSYLISNLNAGTYKLTFTYLGFNTQNHEVVITDQSLTLKRIVLKASDAQLKEVKINDVQTRVEQKGDTTEIKANAFKTNPDASAEDLIKKMPGITNENGTIKAQGEDVKRVLIDGKEFFGDDPNVALKNLPAEMIDKVQVYDKLSDKAAFTGFDDGSGQKTINIITNKSKRKGVFGKIYSGLGSNSVYQAGGNINEFNKTRKLSAIVMSNNINEQNFSMQDIAGVAGSSGGGAGNRGGGGGGRGGASGGASMGGGQRGGGDLSNFMVGNQNGIATTHAGGLNYIDQFGTKLTINAAYFFNYSDNRNTSKLQRNYLTGGDLAQNYTEEATGKQFNTNHRVNFKLGFNPDSNNQFILNPRFGIQVNSIYNDKVAQTAINNFVINNSLNKTINKVSAISFGGTLLWMHKFVKIGRTFSAEINQDYTERLPENRLNTFNNYFGFDTTSNSLIQLAVSPFWSNSYNASVSYTEPIFNKYHQLEFLINPKYSDSKVDRRTNLYDSFNNSFSILDSTLSNSFTNSTLTHNEGINYKYNKDNINISIGASYQGTQLLGNQSFPSFYSIDKVFNNVLPNARLQFKFGKAHNVRFFYRSDVTIPAASQLQDVVDNSNPLVLSSGNKFLNQAFNQRFGSRYNYTNAINAHNAFLMVMFNNTYNFISNATSILKSDSIINGVFIKRGTQFSKPVNLSGYNAFRTFGNYSLPVKFIKCNLNFNAAYNYSKTPAKINDILYFTTNNNYTGGLSLTSNISEKIDFNIGGNITYADVVSRGLKITQTSYYINQLNFKGQWIFYKGFFIHTNGTYYDYRGLGANFNLNYLLWSGGTGIKFLKNNAAEIRLSVFDILNQNNNINRTVTETYAEDSQNLVLRQYYMLTFTYNFKKFAPGTTMPDDYKQELRNSGPYPGGFGNPGGTPPR
jgi:hypothetical protein